MKYLCYLLSALLLTSILPGCEIHDDIDTSVQRKAVVYLRYNYDNGQSETMDEVQTVRLFFFNMATGRLYRDTTLTRNAFLQDTGAMQTYISNGDYRIVTLTNVGRGSSVSAEKLNEAYIDISQQGADPLYFGRVDTPIVKGDSLRFDIDLFKSVYKINVVIEGANLLDDYTDYYFGLKNYTRLTFDNKPAGERRMYKPALSYDPATGELSTSFYTPYFATGEPIEIGVYNDNPQSLYYPELFSTSIEKYIATAPNIGHDVQIDIRIIVHAAGVTIEISDWDGTIIQDEHFGA